MASQRTRWPGKTATALSVVTFLIHVFVGGSDSLEPLLGTELAKSVMGDLHACWHIVTATLLISAFAFWNGGEVATWFAILWLLFAFVFIYVGLYHNGLSGLLTNPQWTILGLTGVMALFDGRGSSGQPRQPK